jgi:phosphomannomutase
MSTALEALKTKALSWAADDPDPETAAAARALVAQGDAAVLADHFGTRLEFGTAGLRGALGPGPNRMNSALVRRVTAGLGHYLLAHVPDARTTGVAIGFDGRIGSREFAADSALVLAAQGIPSFLYDEVCPTPELAHAVVHLGCAAGIMVTASHNPPQDNGYKVYWGNGAQIVPPHDHGISAAVDAVTGLGDLRLPEMAAARAANLVRPVPESALTAYLSKVAALRVHHTNGLRIVYTAMHGVGRRLIEQVLLPAGHTDLHLVAEQADPDGRFPTVKFPNPEEPGALDLSLALAARVGADIVVANDPDADRLALAVPRPDGTWRPLTGNEVGCLLAEDLLTHGPQEPNRLVATTVVSSSLLSRIAEAHGAAYAETLTGFKWIANAALRHEAGGGRFVMGYEEALGYSAGPVVRDKDGVSAALLLCDLAAFEKARGRTLLDALESLARRYGLYVSGQKSMTLPGADGARQIREMMADLRKNPPTDFAGTAVVEAKDLAIPTRPDLPAADVLAWSLDGGGRVLARPSGTEPKIKFYFEVREPVAEGEPLSAADTRARARLAAFTAALMTRLGR